MKNLSITVFSVALAACGGVDIGPGAFGGPLHYVLADPGGPYDGLAGQSVQFDGSGSSDTQGHSLTYNWDFGDGGTSTLAMPTHAYSTAGTYQVTLQVCHESICSVNPSNTTAVISGPTNASAGGIWFGTDSEGDQIIALITETGRFHLLDEFGFQGSGILTVSSANELSADFQIVPPIGVGFADDSNFADCSISGSFAERSTLDASVACTTSQGAESSVTMNLNYQALYELGSSLDMFTGTWTDSSNPGADVVNVDATGLITGQDGGASGCVYSGQVTVIDPNFNLYHIEWTYSSCNGGVTFSGLGAIDNTVSPREFVLAATGEYSFGNPVSLVLFYEQT